MALKRRLLVYRKKPKTFHYNAKALPEGTVRDWGGQQYKKESGEWVKVTRSKGKEEKEQPKSKRSIQDTIKTKEFKDWFSGSKVIDDKGEPLVVYHGTNKDFNEFRDESDGIYFTDDKEHEFIKGTKNTIEGFINIKNPYYAKSRYEVESAIYKGDWNNYKSFAKELEEKGYDGLIYKGGKDKNYEGDNPAQYIIFNPNQVKSIDAKNFDKNSNNIYNYK